MNRPDNPCESSLAYNLGHCVEKSVMRKIGCQPPWRRVSVEGLPLCDNSKMLHKYGHEYFYAVDYGRHNLLKKTNCMLPCSFTEYKVIYLSNVVCYRIITFLLQIAQNPKVYNYWEKTNVSRIWPMFTCEKVLVRKEVEAFPLVSLVADCGGILRLFLGFNFFMVWEWIMGFLCFVIKTKKRK